MNATPLVDLRQVKRVLIIRLSSIGDVVHALPVSAALGRAYPHLEISWVVEEMSAPIVLGNPYVHEVIIIPRDRWKRERVTGRGLLEQISFYRDIRRRRFDLTLDLQGYAKSGILAYASGAKHRFGWSRLRDISRAASRSLPRRPASAHRVDWFLDTVRAFGIDPEPVCFPIDVPETARAGVREMLTEAGLAEQSPFAVLNPATGDQVRRWGEREFAAIAVDLQSRHGLRPVLIGSSKDEDICRAIATRVESAGVGQDCNRPIVLAGRTDLKQLAALLEISALHVAGDTGSLHIAAALGRPVIALFGPTDPDHAGPWGQAQNVIYRGSECGKDCTARVCAFGPGETGEAAAACMRAINPTDVLDLAGRVLAAFGVKPGFS